MRRLGRRERGSAVAEFVMVAGLVVVLGMGVIQLGLVLYARNAMLTGASEGARVGARVGAQPGQAQERARSVIQGALSPAYTDDIEVQRRRTDDGIVVVEVTITAPLPIVGLIGPTGAVRVTGRAFDEAQALEP